MFIILHKRWQRREKWEIKAKASTTVSENMNIGWCGPDNTAGVATKLLVSLTLAGLLLPSTLDPPVKKFLSLVEKSCYFGGTCFPQRPAFWVRICKWLMFINRESAFVHTRRQRIEMGNPHGKIRVSKHEYGQSACMKIWRFKLSEMDWV